MINLLAQRKGNLQAELARLERLNSALSLHKLELSKYATLNDFNDRLTVKLSNGDTLIITKQLVARIIFASVQYVELNLNLVMNLNDEQRCDLIQECESLEIDLYIDENDQYFKDRVKALRNKYINLINE